MIVFNTLLSLLASNCELTYVTFLDYPRQIIKT